MFSRIKHSQYSINVDLALRHDRAKWPCYRTPVLQVTADKSISLVLGAFVLAHVCKLNEKGSAVRLATYAILQVIQHMQYYRSYNICNVTGHTTYAILQVIQHMQYYRSYNIRNITGHTTYAMLQVIQHMQYYRSYNIINIGAICRISRWHLTQESKIAKA